MRGDDSKPVPTRFSSVELEKIDQAAVGLGLGRSAFIRFCVNMFLRAFEAGGNNILPSNWEDIVRSLDNRTREGHGARWPNKGKGGTPMHKATSRRLREKGSNLSNPLNAERKRKRQIGGDEREVAQKVPD